MKRDPNLVRSILLDIEASPPGKPIFGFQYEGRDEAEVLEHVQLMLDANFIDGKVLKGSLKEAWASR